MPTASLTSCPAVGCSALLRTGLMTVPSVLFLDEQLSALDPFLRLRMRAEFVRIQGEPPRNKTR